MQGKIDHAKQTIGKITEALITAPGSKALGERLQAEERALEGLEEQLKALQPRRPRISPHPTAIAAYVEKLAEFVESGDLVRTGDVLRSALAPFRMVPQAEGYRMAGALNLALPELASTGGVI